MLMSTGFQALVAKLNPGSAKISSVHTRAM
jgi:hypothetical protein